MSKIPAAQAADALAETQYDCWACHWRPPGEVFCGTCIQKILEEIEQAKLIHGGKNGGDNNE